MTESERRADPNLAERLTKAVLRLTAVLEQEVDLLQGAKARQLAALVLEKREAAKEYGALLSELGDRNGALADLDNGRRDELAALGRRLAAATEANVRALKAGIEANGRLVRTIAHAVEAARSPGRSYRSDGRSSTIAAGGAPAAVSINQVL